MITKPELLKITDRRSADHAIDVWEHNVTHYTQIAEMVGYDTARELMQNKHKFYEDKPSEVACKRAAKLLRAKWIFHRCQVMAKEARDEALSLYRDRCRACGIPEDNAAGFLDHYFRPWNCDQIELIVAATSQRSLKELRN